MLLMALAIGYHHLTVMMSMDITFTQQGTSRVGRIEGPQIPEFLRPGTDGHDYYGRIKEI
jgi:hypothetical protein